MPALVACHTQRLFIEEAIPIVNNVTKFHYLLNERNNQYLTKPMNSIVWRLPYNFFTQGKCFKNKLSNCKKFPFLPPLIFVSFVIAPRMCKDEKKKRKKK